MWHGACKRLPVAARRWWRGPLCAARRLALALGLLALASCGSSYRGYMTRSYSVRGQTYHPMSVKQALVYQETGTCSWYDESSFFGLVRGTTSLGEKVMPWDLIGAHKTLPLPCVAKVTNLNTGQSVKVRINDRRRRAPLVHRKHLGHQPGRVKPIGHGKTADPGNHQPQRVDRLAALHGHQPYGQCAKQGNGRPEDDADGFWHD